MNRRKTIKALSTGAWTAPILTSVVLPAHGQATPIATTAAPTTVPPPTFNLQAVLSVAPTTGITGSVPMRAIVTLRNTTDSVVPAGTPIIITTDFGTTMVFTFAPTSTSEGGVSVSNSNWTQLGPEMFQYIGPEIPAYGTSVYGWVGTFTSPGAGTTTINTHLDVIDTIIIDNDDYDTISHS